MSQPMLHAVRAEARRNIVVIGASAGGVDAITALVRQLRADIDASFFVVTHVMAEAANHLVDTLNTVGPLLAKHAAEMEEIRLGMIYVAPPDRHLLVKSDHVRITRGPRENRWRPAIDPLFRSAAVAHGRRVVGVLLTGMLDDGTAGLLAIKRCGGIAIVQDPEDAAFPEMPQTAIANVAIDYRLPIADMGAVIARLVQEHVEPGGAAPRDHELEVRVAETGRSSPAIAEQIGKLTPMSCPECSGPLWEQPTGNSLRYVCRVGHAYSVGSLLSAEGEAIEAALWSAVRLLDQRANILNSLAEKDRLAQRERMRSHHAGLAQEARDNADLLRGLLVDKQEERSA
jgi:two-component system, chemotaxis family, protein-glutamate methylesterase/glutaminase